jgi:hypothetical protein
MDLKRNNTGGIMFKYAQLLLLLFLVGSAPLYSQEIDENEGWWYDESSASRPNSNRLQRGMLSIDGNMSLRFSDSPYDEGLAYDLVLAPGAYYFFNTNSAVGILLQIERHSYGRSGINYLGLGSGTKYYINLYQQRRFLNLHLAYTFWFSGGGDGGYHDMQLKYGLGYTEFLTTDIALGINLDINCYSFISFVESQPLGDELRLMMTFGYYINLER